MKFVPNGPINNIPALIQIMAWCMVSAKPLSERETKLLGIVVPVWTNDG